MTPVCDPPARVPAWEFAATGTRWRLYHSGRAEQSVAVVLANAVEHDEARWSRFREDSELSRLNRRAGTWQNVSEETFALLAACERWRRKTDGVFQPLVGGALTAWGYGASIGERAPFTASSPTETAVAQSLLLDRARARVLIPAGATLDVGGIGKGWIAARAAGLLTRLCGDPALLLDAGGDLVAVAGEHAVAVEGLDETWVRLGAGQAVATSGYGRRKWLNGDGRAAHHLIDPATGAPGPRTHATVIAADPVAADVMAKVLALRPALVQTTSYAALVRTPHGATASRTWPDAVQQQ